MPFGKWENFDDCINDPDLKKRYPSLETRKKVCGSLQAKYKKDFDHKLIVEKYNELKLEHPEFDERKLLEEVFSRISNDFIEKLDSFDLNKISKRLENVVLEAEYGIDIQNKLPLDSYIFHGTSVPLGLIESNELRISESLDKEGAIFFTTNLEEAFTYGDTVIAIPVNELQKYEIKRNIYGNIQEKSTLMIENDIELTDNVLINNRGSWYGIIEFHKILDPEEFEFDELEGIERKDPEEVQKLIKKLNEKNSSGKGRGWHGESERHARARKIGRADLQEDLKQKKINSAFLTLEEYKLLKEMIPKGLKKLQNAIYYGRQSFKSITNMEIIQESPYIFFDIRNEKEPIFILNKPLNISLNNLEIINKESIYESEGTKYYYKYKGKKYFQEERFDHNYEIWTRADAPIYPYVTLKELKPRLKLRGLKRIYNSRLLPNYISKPFELTRMEEKKNDKGKEVGKGRGWYGDPERHAKARKVGKADLQEDLKTNDFSFTETMQRSMGEGKIVQKGGTCEECGKKVKEFYYKKLCKECYIKRVKHYIKVYDLQEDYPVEGYTKKDGTKVKTHTRGEQILSDKEINDLYTIIDTEDYKLFMNYSHKWTSGIDLSGRSMAIYLANSNEKLKKYLQFEHFGRKIPKDVLLYRVGDIENSEYEWSSFWTSLESAKAYQKRFGANIIYKYKTNIKNVIPSLSGAGEVYAKNIIPIDFTQDIYIKRPIFIFDSIEKAFEQACDMFDSVNLTEDEAIRRVESHIPGGQTRIQKLWEQQKAFERAKRLGRAMGVETLVSPVQSVTMPFSITNTETGKTIKGEVVENIEKNTRQLQPVSSSNVRASGQFGSELLIQFHPSKLQPMRTYRFMFETPERAKEANESLLGSGSPGRWVWQNLRGHTAGEKVVPSKLGPSLSPPGQGLPTIGGTSASLVPYKISNRVPVQRVKNFNEILKKMKRSSSNITTDPMTGSRIEALLGTRKELREMKEPSFRKGTHGLPPIRDFVYIGNINELEEDYSVRGHWRHLKSGKKTWIKGYEKEDKKTIIKEEKIPLWKELKDKRKELKKISIQMDKLDSIFLKMSIDKKREMREKLFAQFTKLNHEIKAQIPKRKQHEQYLEYFEEMIKWTENVKKDDKKEIDRELKLKEKKGYKPNFTKVEWEMLLEQYEQWDDRIKEYKKNLEETKKEIKKADIFESELFEDKSNIKYIFDVTLHKKLRIQKGLIAQHPHLVEDKINTINNAFYDLPRKLQNSCRQIRIFEKANDDPLFGTLRSCGGFYNPVEETITIGMKTERKDMFGYSREWLKEATIHEAAHALDFTTLTDQERYDTFEFFKMNYEKLKKRGEYAATDKREFFAEGYTKLLMNDHHWFMGLSKGTKGFFQSIMKKYDFIISHRRFE